MWCIYVYLSGCLFMFGDLHTWHIYSLRAVRVLLLTLECREILSIISKSDLKYSLVTRGISQKTHVTLSLWLIYKSICSWQFMCCLLTIIWLHDAIWRHQSEWTYKIKILRFLINQHVSFSKPNSHESLCELIYLHNNNARRAIGMIY